MACPQPYLQLHIASCLSKLEMARTSVIEPTSLSLLFHNATFIPYATFVHLSFICSFLKKICLFAYLVVCAYVYIHACGSQRTIFNCHSLLSPLLRQNLSPSIFFSCCMSYSNWPESIQTILLSLPLSLQKVAGTADACHQFSFLM